MSVLGFAVTVAIVFGFIAFWRGVVERWQLPYSLTARKTLRMSLAMCIMAVVTIVMLLVGAMWLIAMLLGAVVGVLVHIWLVRQMERVSK